MNGFRPAGQGRDQLVGHGRDRPVGTFGEPLKFECPAPTSRGADQPQQCTIFLNDFSWLFSTSAPAY
jgi:hypothetical protein